MQARISVILPVYNVAKYIAKCLDSIINQSYRDLEIIIVNDSSPDDSESIIIEYQKKDNRIKYIKNEQNQGLFISRKIGFMHSTGAYIVNLDPDDYFCSNTILEEGIPYFSDSKVDLVAFSWRVVHEKEEDSQYDSIHQLPLKKLTNIHEKLTEYFKMSSITESMWAKIFKRKVLDSVYQQIPISHVVFQEDALCVLPIFLHTDVIQLIENIGNVYLQRSSSLTQFNTMSRDKALKTLIDWIYVSNITEKWLKEQGLWETYYKQFYMRSFSFYNWMFRPLQSRFSTEEYQKHELLFIEAFSNFILRQDEVDILKQETEASKQEVDILKQEIDILRNNFFTKVKKKSVVILKKIGLYSILKKIKDIFLKRGHK